MIFVNATTLDKLELPEKIYKYRNWTNEEHKRILTHNEIYFSAPSNIDEQHECNLETDYASVTREMIFKYAYQEAELKGAKSEDEKKIFAANTVRTTKFFDKTHQQKGDALFKSKIDKQLSIFCVSEHPDNLTLWNMFAGGHTGFCVGINTRKMFDNKTVLGGGGKVQYYAKKDMPKRKGLTFTENERVVDMLTVIFSLNEMFSAEDEYRFFKMDIENNNATIGQESIQEIILGSKISNKDRDEIISITSKNFPDALILQSVLSDDNLIVTFEEFSK